MSGNVIQAPFYNSGFYDTGAGGGGGGSQKIKGYLSLVSNSYPYVKIGNKFYTCKNLDEIFTGINDGYNGDNSGAQRPEYGIFGRYYNPASLTFIDDYLQNNANGWRVCTKDDIDYLLLGNDSLDYINFEFNTLLEITNKELISIAPTGHYNGTVPQHFGSRFYLWTSTRDGSDTYYASGGPGITTAIVSAYGTPGRYMPVRLCCDA